MKKSNVRLIIFLALLLMMLSVIGANAIAEDRPVLKVLAPIDGNTPDENNVAIQMIEEKFNVELQVEKNGSDAAHYEKLNLLLAADDLPDIIIGFKLPDAKSSGMKGMLLPLNEYEDLMPNYFKWMRKDSNTMKNIIAGDGNVYSAPRYDQYLRVNRVPIMRVDLLEELGLEIPTNFDELYEVLKAVKAAHPDNLGLISAAGYQDLSNGWGFYFNTNVGYGTTPGMYYDRYQDEWVYGPTNEGYLELITYFHKLWTEGLMDPEFFTTTSPTSKGTMGNFLVINNNDDWSWKMELQHKQAYPDSNLDYEIVIPFKSESMPELAVSMRQHVNSGWCWSVSAKTKYPELCASIIDWAYSEEGSFALNCGVEGVHYNFVEQDGKTVWKYVPTINREYNPEGANDPRSAYCLRHPHWYRLTRDYYDEYRADDEYMVKHYETLDEMSKLPGYQRGNDNIELSFTDEQYDEMNQIILNLQTVVDEMTYKFIMGERPIEEYPQFKNEIERYGSKRLEEIYAEAYANWKNASE